VGFNLYREDGTKVNQTLIPAGRRHYELDDRAVAERYYLEEITSSGRVNRHGPLVTGRRLGPDVTKRFEHGQPAHRGFSAEARPEVAVDAAKTAAVMVSVRDTGIVRVPFSELATRFGKKEDQIEKEASKGSLSVTMNGATVAYTSTADALFFFGEKSDSIYSRDRIYRVSLGKGERMANVAAGASSGALSTFTGVADFETDAFPATVLPLDPESDYWFWDYVVSGDPTFGRKTFTVDVPAVAGTGSASLDVRLQGALDQASHQANVIVNGVPVGDLSWTDLNSRKATLTVPAGVLQDGANTIEVEGVLAPAAAFDVFYIDGFTLRYDRYARPVNGVLEAAIKTAVSAGPFTTTPMVLDITKRTRPTLLTGVALTGDDVAIALPSTTKNVFLAEQFVTPVAYRSAADPSLKNQRAAYVVVAPASMRSGAEALASLRQREGLSTFVADLDQIYDEFSFGTPTPHAIRSYVASLMKSSQRPRYVVLAGTGTVDYRGLTQSPGPVPPMMIRTKDGLFASDTKIADANNNGSPDLAIGRIPVSTNAELLAYVSKLQNHSTAEATDPIVFSADATDQDTNFGHASDDSATPLKTLPRMRLHIDEIGPQAARNGLLDAWQNGTPLVSWIGHGGLDQIASSGILTAGDAPALLSAGRLPVMVAMTCTINRFEDGIVEPLGSALTRQADGGALAVWSATGISNHENARELQRTFMRNAAAKPQLRIGDLIVQTLAAHPSDTAGIYLLLGDPAVTMQLPKEIANGGTPVPSGE
ncbi:MAG TPA: C25 family cysteine peptidase, partial [Thermoanaerobaculia bacterium]|nr:C25 family cysteine peptidase [Thermoanaerobaculia bacterium]